MTLSITQVKTPEKLISAKCPYPMRPEGITIHETGNYATAMSEVSYMLSNNNEVSYHYAVDDERAVQGLPTNRNGWHSGDGSGGSSGNRTTIAIETCYNYKDGHLTNSDNVYNKKYLAARDNAIELAAQLFVQHKLVPKKGVTLHRHFDWSKKNCPQRIINDGYWDTFCSKVVARYNQIKKGSTITGIKWRYAKEDLKLRTTANWNSTVGVVVPFGYGAQINYDVKSNGFTQVIFRDKKYWYKDSLVLYWFDKDPCETYKATTNINFRFASNWDSKVVAKRKKGDSIRVISKSKNGWLKCVLDDTVGYIPNNKKYLIK